MIQLSHKGLVAVTVVYVLSIYATLPLARPLLTFIYGHLERETLGIIMNALLLLFIFLSIFCLYYYSRRSLLRFALLVLVFSSTFFLAMTYDIPEERFHFLQYGLLGYLIYALFFNRRRLPEVPALCLVAFIGGSDELVQYFLPSRVGDMRDVVMNAVAGLSGVAVGSLWKR